MDELVFEVATDDAEFSAAMGEAQSRIGVMLKILQSQSPGEHVEMGPFFAKVRPVVDEVAEGLWLKIVWWDETPEMFGLVTNQPENIALDLGDRLKFTAEAVTDWMYWDGKKCAGAFTTRVLLRREGMADEEISRDLNEHCRTENRAENSQITKE